MAEFALATPFPALVGRIGARDDLPPHVTVLVPCPGEVGAIAEVLAPFEPFDVSFSRLERFPEILWLVPDPAEPFISMTEAMVARFPDFPPYGGIHDSVVPHLTVAETELEEAAGSVELLLPLHSRAETVVLYERVHETHWHEVHVFGL